MNWFKKLKRWQRGGLIGLVIGAILGFLVPRLIAWELCPHVVYYWILYPHFFLMYTVHLINDVYKSAFGFSSTLYEMSEEIYSFMILVFYGGMGAIAGLIQQIAKPFIRWPLTGLFILFMLLFYLVGAGVCLFLALAIQYP